MSAGWLCCCWYCKYRFVLSNVFLQWVSSGCYFCFYFSDYIFVLLLLLLFKSVCLGRFPRASFLALNRTICFKCNANAYNHHIEISFRFLSLNNTILGCVWLSSRLKAHVSSLARYFSFRWYIDSNIFADFRLLLSTCFFSLEYALIFLRIKFAAPAYRRVGIQ